ncbi:MAG: hypothetical protein H6Q69_1963 [Firmicutes bacterium]|nr:hypothetical protein [Bacillota bacterium]
MKRSILIVMMLVLFIPAVFAADSVPAVPQDMLVTEVMQGNAYLPKGTMIRAELLTEVNSGKNKVGDPISFKVLEDVTVADVIIIPKGTVGNGYVKVAKKAGMFGKGGGIELDASTLNTSTGIEIPVTMDFSKYGGERHIEMNYNNSVGGALISGLLPGSNQTIKAGSTLIILAPLNVDLQTTLKNLKPTLAPQGNEVIEPFVQEQPTTQSPYAVGNEWSYSSDKGTIDFIITKVDKKMIKGKLTSQGHDILTFNQECQADKGQMYITLKAKDKDHGKNYSIQMFFRADGTIQYIVPNSPKEDKNSIILKKVHN